MKGIKVKINDVNTGNTFEMVKFVVQIIAISKNLYLSQTELHALTFFVINGYSKVSKEKLLENKLLKTKNTVNNLVHSFKRNSIIVKTSYGYDINPSFKLGEVNDLDGVKIEMIVKK